MHSGLREYTSQGAMMHWGEEEEIQGWLGWCPCKVSIWNSLKSHLQLSFSCLQNGEFTEAQSKSEIWHWPESTGEGVGTIQVTVGIYVVTWLDPNCSNCKFISWAGSWSCQKSSGGNDTVGTGYMNLQWSHPSSAFSFSTQKWLVALIYCSQPDCKCSCLRYDMELVT